MKQNNAIAQVVIEDVETLCDFFESIADNPRIGLDTEFMRVKTYFPELCLVQISATGGHAACIDPLMVGQVALAKSMSGCSMTIVAHSAGQDLEVLHTCLGYLPRVLFDTQVAAALLGYGEQVSYHALVKQLTGIHLEKGETRTDWCRRPLTDAQIEYAFADVDHLPHLHDTLAERIEAEGKTGWLASACEELLEKQKHDGEARVVTRFKGGANIPLARQSMLRDLVLWRERVARKTNRPREWIVSSQDLVAVAEKTPETLGKLVNCTSLNRAQADRYGKEIVEIVSAAGKSVSSEVIWPPRDELQPEQKAQVKKLQKSVRELCADLSVSPAILASRADLEALVVGRPGRLDSGWRREVIDPILKESI